MNDSNFKSKIGLLCFSDKKKIMKFLLYVFVSSLFFWIFGEIGGIILIILGIIFIIYYSFLLVSRTIFFPDQEDKHDNSETVDDFINRM